MYKDYITFIIKGVEVNLISDKIGDGQNTVAEINDTYYYMGDENPTLLTAVSAWQEVNDKTLTQEEMNQVLIDNKVVSEAF